jgi:hypothetical protein
MNMNVDGHHRRGQPKKRWMDCIKDDIKREKKRMSMEMTSDRTRKHDVPTPLNGISGR